MPSDPSGPRPHCARKWPLSTRQDEIGEDPFPSGGPGRESPVPGGQGFGRQFAGAIAGGGPGGHPGKPNYTLHPTNEPAPAPGIAPPGMRVRPSKPCPPGTGVSLPGPPGGNGSSPFSSWRVLSGHLGAVGPGAGGDKAQSLARHFLGGADLRVEDHSRRGRLPSPGGPGRLRGRQTRAFPLPNGVPAGGGVWSAAGAAGRPPPDAGAAGGHAPTREEAGERPPRPVRARGAAHGVPPKNPQIPPKFRAAFFFAVRTPSKLYVC